MAPAATNPTAIALFCLLLIAAASSSAAAAAAAYTNYTVGGNSGWFFDEATNATSANYSAWAASQTFNLGDYLLFNTNTNQTVIQTYNLTTYQACSTDDASDDDTFQYGGGSEQFGEALSVAVPLTLEGPNYFFSDADDGAQCQDGMRFEIDVKHGAGLPPSLSQPPPPPPYAEPPGPDAANPLPVAVVDTPGNGGSGGGAGGRGPAWGVSLLLATPLLFF
ncbi:cucumber peeling cupredoxin-like [Syzygium oleosum]|uniref:cucumber peeling cupredoxin-like n=1 Tax=Syzygium oleosum TaxID=219896 RepID=UPI0024B9BA85|nr:cucumber peeling cupredoxin-like [Syzygium oleosum]